ncbi:hypothetical protein HEK131_53530 [Streptomyces seoulensis]|nr:hypothetical protein HEK131_53530 [Streptomyces seoulensis]
MGGTTAPVRGSAVLPAWIARVSKCSLMCLSLMCTERNALAGVLPDGGLGAGAGGSFPQARGRGWPSVGGIWFA